jgi:hypothetical protein
MAAGIRITPTKTARALFQLTYKTSVYSLFMLRQPGLQIDMFPFRVFHTAPWFRMIVMMRFSFRALCFLGPPAPPVPLFTPALSCRLVAMSGAHLGMVNSRLIELHLLLL